MNKSTKNTKSIQPGDYVITPLHDPKGVWASILGRVVDNAIDGETRIWVAQVQTHYKDPKKLPLYLAAHFSINDITFEKNADDWSKGFIEDALNEGLFEEHPTRENGWYPKVSNVVPFPSKGSK